MQRVDMEPDVVSALLHEVCMHHLSYQQGSHALSHLGELVC